VGEDRPFPPARREFPVSAGCGSTNASRGRITFDFGVPCSESASLQDHLGNTLGLGVSEGAVNEYDG
jgi:hypothetical protein